MPLAFGARSSLPYVDRPFAVAMKNISANNPREAHSRSNDSLKGGGIEKRDVLNSFRRLKSVPLGLVMNGLRGTLRKLMRDIMSLAAAAIGGRSFPRMVDE